MPVLEYFLQSMEFTMESRSPEAVTQMDDEERRVKGGPSPAAPSTEGEGVSPFLSTPFSAMDPLTDPPCHPSLLQKGSL